MFTSHLSLAPREIEADQWSPSNPKSLVFQKKSNEGFSQTKRIGSTDHSIEKNFRLNPKRKRLKKGFKTYSKQKNLRKQENHECSCVYLFFTNKNPKKTKRVLLFPPKKPSIPLQINNPRNHVHSHPVTKMPSFFQYP